MKYFTLIGLLALMLVARVYVGDDHVDTEEGSASEAQPAAGSGWLQWYPHETPAVGPPLLVGEPSSASLRNPTDTDRVIDHSAPDIDWPEFDGTPRWALDYAGVPGRLHDEFLRVAWCESGYDFDAVGDRGSSLGWFQIQPKWHLWRLGAVGEELDPLLLFNPVVNAKVAWHLYQEAGWGPWSCSAW